MTAPADVVVVLCSAPAAAAEALATKLVEEQLCACVNVSAPVRSVYRWQGVVERAEELLLLVKTTAAAADRLSQRLVELHPYDVPEVLVLPVAGGHAPYLQWVADSVR
ncbi:MAG: divalent-cation tolerance protein CutA [Planctomycetes bacterium]|nr:divalent-cation tolerance protein CutA [Planctomycetota bacterium]